MSDRALHAGVGAGTDPVHKVLGFKVITKWNGVGRLAERNTAESLYRHKQQQSAEAGEGQKKFLHRYINPRLQIFERTSAGKRTVTNTTKNWVVWKFPKYRKCPKYSKMPLPLGAG
jgi:hypothetical protein